MIPGRLPRAALVAALAVIVLAGCTRLSPGSADDKGARAVPEKPKLRVGALAVVDDAPLYLAHKRGYFAAEGLEVDLVRNETPPVQQLVGNAVDIAFTDYVSLFGAQVRGAGQFRLLAEGYQATDGTMGVVSLQREIDEPLDLAGKRIAVNTDQDAGARVVGGALVANGVDPRKVTYRAMPFTAMAGALRKGEVDAAWMVEPFITEAGMVEGARLVLDAFRGPAADFPISGYAATLDFAQRNPETVAAFRRAINRAQREASSRAAVEQVITAYTDIDPRTAVIMSIGKFPTSDAPSPVRMQRVPDLMLRIGLLRTRFDARTLLD